MARLTPQDGLAASLGFLGTDSQPPGVVAAELSLSRIPDPVITLEVPRVFVLVAIVVLGCIAYALWERR